jgi:hypothetical protein
MQQLMMGPRMHAWVYHGWTNKDISPYNYELIGLPGSKSICATSPALVADLFDD